MYVVLKRWFIVDDNGVWHWHNNYVDPGQPIEETEGERESKAIASLML
jgi:hypothetical protein